MNPNSPQERVPLKWEGKTIGSAAVTLHQREQSPSYSQDGETVFFQQAQFEVELHDVEPIWLRTALHDSIVNQNAYAMRRHRGS
jgi:hypothetical protein